MINSCPSAPDFIIRVNQVHFRLATESPMILRTRVEDIGQKDISEDLKISVDRPCVTRSQAHDLVDKFFDKYDEVTK